MKNGDKIDYTILFDSMDKLKKEPDYSLTLDCCIESQEIEILKNIVDQINEPNFVTHYSA